MALRRGIQDRWVPFSGSCQWLTRRDLFAHLERITAMFPDIVRAIRKQLHVDSAIIEAEAVAFNESIGDFYRFQVTVQRKRKYQVEEMAKEFPLALIAFDLLYAAGCDYMEASYDERPSFWMMASASGKRSAGIIETGFPGVTLNRASSRRPSFLNVRSTSPMSAVG
jgi:hypothetical protein